jgi:hypothetical protein
MKPKPKNGAEIAALRATLAAAETEVKALRHDFEALLNTLGASKHPWIARVHHNASAAYAALKQRNGR